MEIVAVKPVLYTAAFLLCLYVLAKKWNHPRKPKQNLPRGPKGLPLVGNFLQALRNPHIKFCQWAYQYGKVYSLEMCGKTVILINDVKTMRQVFGNVHSTGKYLMEMFRLTTRGNNGLGMTEGKVWQEQRKFYIKSLRNSGFGRTDVVESIAANTAQEIIQWLKCQAGKNEKRVVVSLKHELVEVMGNQLWFLLSGQCQPDSKDGAQIGRQMLNWFEALQQTAKTGLMFLPVIKYIAPELSGYNRFCQVCIELETTVQRAFEIRRKAELGSSASEPKDLISAYLKNHEQCQDTRSSFYGEQGWRHTIFSVVILLLGGGETLASTFNWMINYIAANPHVQRKMQQEMDAELGMERNPKLEDRLRLSYLDAVVMETLRISSLAPFGIMHRILEDIQFEDYLLPKDAILVANIYHCNHNKHVWGDPHNFRPERFLVEDLEQRKRLRAAVAAFQPGRRVCPGENFAKDNLFLIAAKVFQHLEFNMAEKCSKDEYMKPVAGYNLMPPQVGIQVTVRTDNSGFQKP